MPRRDLGMRCRAWWLGCPDSEATGEVRFGAIMACAVAAFGDGVRALCHTCLVG